MNHPLTTVPVGKDSKVDPLAQQAARYLEGRCSGYHEWSVKTIMVAGSQLIEEEAVAQVEAQTRGQSVCTAIATTG